ncbi:MAG: hypothetical protein ACXAE3_04940 [Candidatus Kariarchaeaceae archaeon]
MTLHKRRDFSTIRSLRKNLVHSNRKARFSTQIQVLSSKSLNREVLSK